MAKVSRKDAALRIWLKLHRCYVSVLTVSGTSLREFKLSESQFGVLDYLASRGSSKIGVLCSKMMVSGGNMTLILDNLEKNGNIRRIHNREDRRSITVEITEKGLKLYEKVLDGYSQSMASVLAVLDEKEQELFSTFLKKLGLSISERIESGELVLPKNKTASLLMD
ncbi:MAG: HTH-type transcriptional regulator MhqR [Ignavibacteriaceae bacterium]|nr:HTH-type transcriptional regulator MhqR [Ignavibacteriaceae bacterium]